MAEPRRRFEAAIRFLQARLSPEGYLGLHLTIGMIAIMLAGWCFREISQDYSRTGWLSLMDQQTAAVFSRIVTPEVTRVVRTISACGSVGGVVIGSVCLAMVLALTRRWLQLLTLALTMLGGSVLNIALKNLFQRHRPVLENPLVTLSSFGFPSGHTMGTTLLAGAIAIFAAARFRGWQMRALIMTLAAIWVVLIGATRIYLGAHFFSDVLGAIAAGAAWLAFCWTAVETLRRWRTRRRGRARNHSRD